MRDLVVEATVKLLLEMQQMPVEHKVGQLDHAVGIIETVEHITTMLAAGGKARMVLLYGMGGAGKTTAARAVFRHLQAGNPTLLSCFLQLDPNMGTEDILQRQKQLLQELASKRPTNVNNAEHGRVILAEQLKEKKVMLVVDNVWGRQQATSSERGTQLDWLLPKNIMEVLGKGSMVLVTSRDEMAARELEGGPAVERLKMKLLSEQLALELFCWHAFGCSSIPASERKWSWMIVEVVARCGGLPLALEVVGRHLRSCGDTEVFWRQVDNALPAVYQEDTVFASLQLSWDALCEEEQQTLLDIVFFLKRQDWELVQAYSSYRALDRLVELGLVVKHLMSTGFELMPTGFVHASENLKSRSDSYADVHDTIAEFCKSTRSGVHHGRHFDLSNSDHFQGDASTVRSAATMLQW
jgi:DNA polymerase III delta prime subunit